MQTARWHWRRDLGNGKQDSRAMIPVDPETWMARTGSEHSGLSLLLHSWDFPSRSPPQDRSERDILISAIVIRALQCEKRTVQRWPTRVGHPGQNDLEAERRSPFRYCPVVQSAVLRAEPAGHSGQRQSACSAMAKQRRQRNSRRKGCLTDQHSQFFRRI
jgi:hypothetical protein